MLTWRTIWSTAFKSVLQAGWGVGATCRVARCVLALVVSGDDVSHCTMSVDYSTGGEFQGLGAGKPPWTEIRFSTSSSSIVNVGEVVTILQNGLTGLGTCFADDLSGICSATVFTV